MNTLRLIGYWENRNNGQSHCPRFGYSLTGENRDELICMGADHPRLISACGVDNSTGEPIIREIFEKCGIFANVGPALRAYNQYELREGLFWLEEFQHERMEIHGGELVPVGKWRWKIGIDSRAIVRLKKQHERRLVASV